METALQKEFIYKAPVEKLWLTLTDTASMQEWYFPQLQQFEPEIGYRFKFDDPHATFQKEWVVTDIIPGKTFTHTWAYKGYPGISEVRFDVSPDGNNSRLRVTQTGLESFPDDPHFKRNRFEAGWDNLLGKNLRGLLEG